MCCRAAPSGYIRVAEHSLAVSSQCEHRTVALLRSQTLSHFNATWSHCLIYRLSRTYYSVHRQFHIVTTQPVSHHIEDRLCLMSHYLFSQHIVSHYIKHRLYLRFSTLYHTFTQLNQHLINLYARLISGSPSRGKTRRGIVV